MSTTATAAPAADPAEVPVPAVARLGLGVIAALGALALLLSAGRYGYFGDELYFRAAGDRLAPSYGDQGPLLPLLAHVMDTLAPDSLFWLRFPAVVAMTGAVVLTGLIARELGGGRGAQLLAAAGFATGPVLLGQGTLLATNTVDTALWTVVVWLVVRWVRTRADRLLLVAALVTAVDFQVKWLIPYFWLAAGLAALVFGPRDLVRRPLLWLGAGIVVASAVPALLWQARHGWPQLAMSRVVALEQELTMGRALFLPVALAGAGLLGVLLVLYGTWRLFRAPELRPYRFLAAAAVLLVVVFVVQNGRPYYVVGVFPVLLAAGAVELSRRRMPRWTRWLVPPLVLVSTVPLLYTLPWSPASELSPVDDIGDAAANLTVNGQFGWPELAAATGAAYRSLPPEVAAHTVVLADSYWQASAIDQFGVGLPPVYSTSRGFWFFGVPPESARTVLWVGAEPPTDFAAARRLSTVDTRLGLPGAAKGVGIWRCDDPVRPWPTLWAERAEL